MKRRKKRRNALRVRNSALFILSLVLFLTGAFMLTRYFINSAQTKRQNAALRQQFEAARMPTDTPEPIPDMTLPPEPETTPEVTLAPSFHLIRDGLNPALMEFYDINEDTIAWLRIEDVVSLPVVYRDNEYYINHDFYRKENNAGTLFADVSTPLADDTQLMIIHGHNMIDRTMFGMLHRYLSGDYMRDHGFATFETLSDSERYVVFAAGEVKMNDFLQLFQGHFSSETEFNEYIGHLLSITKTKANIDVAPCDTVLILSTCSGDDNKRMIVALRKIRADEKEGMLQLHLDASLSK